MSAANSPGPFYLPSTSQLEHRLQIQKYREPELLPAQGCSGQARLPGTRVLINNHPEHASDSMLRYLRRSNITPKLDRLSPHLWLVSKPCSSHIRSLLHQQTRGRDHIIVVDNADLHLVWSWHRIFIRAIPRYMLSAAFWEYARGQTSTKDIFRACAGFMRTYSHLIQSENDFAMATRGPQFLIPPEDDLGNPITYERWLDFIQPFADLKDKDVSPRYQYGELRLTRLNQCARIFLRELTFHHIEGQWGSYLQRFLTSLLSAFAVLSIILNAMQVGLAVESLDKAPPHPMVFLYVSWWFSVLTLGIATSGVFCIFLLVLFMWSHDIWFARTVMGLREGGRGADGDRQDSEGDEKGPEGNERGSEEDKNEFYSGVTQT